MDTDLGDFAEFMRRRERAANAYVQGDPAPLSQMAARILPATFLSPRGGWLRGSDEVRTTYEREAGAFVPGGTTRFEVLHAAAGDGMAYWTGFQRATLRMADRDQPVPFNLRVTEVFRREGREWKLVHRHADNLPIEPLARSS